MGLGDQLRGSRFAAKGCGLKVCRAGEVCKGPSSAAAILGPVGATKDSTAQKTNERDAASDFIEKGMFLPVSQNGP